MGQFFYYGFYNQNTRIVLNKDNMEKKKKIPKTFRECAPLNGFRFHVYIGLVTLQCFILCLLHTLGQVALVKQTGCTETVSFYGVW